MPPIATGMPVPRRMSFEDRFRWGTRTHVMGILNVTPDSFSGDGLAPDAPTGPADAVARAVALGRAFVVAGADILDIGGESTRPGADPVGAAEEARRVVPVVAALREALPEVALSVDTYRASTAAAAVDAGADLVNDVWGGTADAEMLPLIAARGAAVVLMHNASRRDLTDHDPRVGGQYLGGIAGDPFPAVVAGLQAMAAAAAAAGIRRERIVLDPGIGFGKTLSQNLALLNGANRLRELGYPVLIGASRKSFIGRVLDLGVEDRLEGTAAACAVAALRGADIVRVHDVRQMVRVVRMTDAICGRGYAACDAPSGGDG